MTLGGRIWGWNCTEKTNQACVRFECCHPIWCVEICRPAGIYLCQRDQGRRGAWIRVSVEEVEKLHKEYKARGVTIRRPPTNYSWALQMHVEDPDGNVLRMASEQWLPLRCGVLQGVFCGHCNDYHVTDSCLKKPVQN